MLKNPFKNMKKREWLLWLVSLVITLISNILAGKIDAVTLCATSIGVTALIFIARGDVWGQILTVIFSFLYSIVSLRFHYYGEMITYLCMSMPIAALSVITWLRHPYRPDANEVKIHRMTKNQTAVMLVTAAVVTWLFYYILKYFNTANLAVSTASITTSYLASFLMLYRNSYYAVAYAANDVVLMVLWVLASMESFSYFPMVICFFMFFINDLYGFISWKKREKRQR